MAGFTGALNDFSTGQLLNLVHLARKSGSLHLETGNKRVRLVFIDGCLVYARPVPEPDLADILSDAGQIDVQALRRLRERLEKTGETEAGLELVIDGVLARQDILTGIRQYAIDLVRQLFAWSEGTFAFRPDEKAPDDRILINLPLDALAAEGINKLSEQELLDKEIPDLNAELIFTDRPEGIGPQISLGGPEWQVISHINTQHTLAGIARAANLTELEIRRAVSRLLQAGIVQFRQETGKPGRKEASAEPAEGKKKENRKVRLPFFQKNNPK